LVTLLHSGQAAQALSQSDTVTAQGKMSECTAALATSQTQLGAAVTALGKLRPR
jgi:hypothetical protein